MIRVMIVDDHPLVRTGLRGLLDQTNGISVVGECSDGAQVADTADRVSPDLVLMDHRMPGMSGIAATRELIAQQSRTRVLMMTGYMNPGVLHEADQAGAMGFLLKGDPKVLISAVRTVAGGGTFWPVGFAPTG